MMDLSGYYAVRDRMRPGDVIAFGGTEVISYLIDAFSGSCVSHVAVVRQGMQPGKDVLITESTIENGRSGPQTNSLTTTLSTYRSGSHAWWLPLAEEVRKEIDWVKFYAYIGAEEGSVSYDVPGLFGFLVRSLPILGPRICQSENAKRMFCSGWGTAIFEHCGVLRGINWSKVTPQDLCEMKLYRECVQILGNSKAISRFNTV